MPCQLCGAEKIYDIQSHYSPRAITKSTFGDTDKEEIYTITPYRGSIEAYKRRAIPQDEPEKIKSLPNTGKGIFCKKCEDAFGLVENLCQSPLNEYLNKLHAGSLRVIRVKEVLKSFSIPVPSNIMKLFLYTVVWRQCLQNKSEGNSVLNNREFAYLQSILLKELFKDKLAIIASLEYSSYPAISIFTSNRNIEKDGSVTPSAFVTNPELFFLGKYFILYYKNKTQITPNLYTYLGIPSFLHNTNITLQTGELSSRIGKIPEKIHTYIINKLVRKSVDDLTTFHVFKIAKYKNISLKEAYDILRKLMRKICEETKSDKYDDCLIKASNVLCNE